MGKVARGTDKPDLPPVDWQATKAEILSRLDVAEEYRALGLRWADDAPGPKGFRGCYAAGRIDHAPSAAVKIRPGDANHGVYTDSGGEHLTCGFFDFALRFGRFGSWMEVFRHYAEKAGVQIGRVEFSGQKILESVYRYRDAAGAVAYGVFRYRQPNGKKDFRQYPWRDGAWVKEKGCMEGVSALPYRLPELVAAPADEMVIVVEGEKDADRAAAEGLVATTNHQGSKSTDQTWPRDSFLPHFKGRDVVVIPDNDKPGRDHSHRICRHLQGVAARVRYLELPDLGPKGDLTDWLDSGHGIDELGRLAHRALDWTPDLAAEDDVRDCGPIVPAVVKFDPNDIVLVRMSSIVPREVRWLVPGKIPLGKLTLLAGDPGLGKSFVTMDMAARLSVGGEIPGAPGECFVAASSLIFFAEDGADDTVAPRLIRAGADLDKILTLESVRDQVGRLTPFNLGYLDHLDYALSTIPDCRLMVIDPIANYIGRDADEHRNAEIRAVLTPLAKLAEKRDVAVVLVTHINKGSATKALKRITGSIAYSALARTVWLVAEDRDSKGRRLMLPVKNNLAPDQTGLAYSIIDGRVIWDAEPIDVTANEALADGPDEGAGRRGGGTPKRTVEQAAEFVTAYLAEHGESPSNDIFTAGAAKGFSRDALYRCKDFLGIRPHKNGFGKDAPWSWNLPANGHAIAGRITVPADDDETPF